jgi:hypothetical protein
MPQPRGMKRVDGHRLARDGRGNAACECGWESGQEKASAANKARTAHLVDVRMDLLP